MYFAALPQAFYDELFGQITQVLKSYGVDQFDTAKEKLQKDGLKIMTLKSFIYGMIERYIEFDFSTVSDVAYYLQHADLVKYF